MWTVARNVTLPEDSAFYSLLETINYLPFHKAKNAKKRLLKTLAKAHAPHREGLSILGVCVLNNAYVFVGCLAGGREPYSKTVASAHTALGVSINKREGRVGPTIRRRPTTEPAPDQEALIRLMFALDYAPVAGKLVSKPEDHRYGTYRYYALGKREPSLPEITEPVWYKELGSTPAERQEAYRKLGELYYQQGLLKEYIDAVLDGRPIGDTVATMARAKVLARARQWKEVKETAHELFDAKLVFGIGPTMGRIFALERARGKFHCALAELLFEPP